MARPTEFDREQAVVLAMTLFWRQGYTATSLSQLLAAMAIGRSSFYAAFGDKRSLYVECLNLFYLRTRRIMEEAWAMHRSSRAFAEFFRQTLFAVPERRTRRGCMMVNTVLELAGVDDGLNRLAAQQLEDIETLFRDCFAALQASGEFPGQRSPGELADCLMVINQGLRVASRKGVDRTRLQRSVNASLAALGPVHTG